MTYFCTLAIYCRCVAKGGTAGLPILTRIFYNVTALLWYSRRRYYLVIGYPHLCSNWKARATSGRPIYFRKVLLVTAQSSIFCLYFSFS